MHRERICAAGGRCQWNWHLYVLQHVMFRGVFVASHYNTVIEPIAERLRIADKRHKAVMTAVVRKLVTIENALYKSRLN